MQNVITFSHSMCAHVKGPKKFLARWCSVHLRRGTWLNSRNMPVFHFSYHAEFGRCRSNPMGVNRSPKNLGDAGPRSLTWSPFPSCYLAEFGCCRSNQMGVSRGPKKSVGRWAPATLGWGVSDS